MTDETTPPADPVTPPPADPAKSKVKPKAKIVADLIGTDPPTDPEPDPALGIPVVDQTELAKRMAKLEKKIEKDERDKILNSELFTKYKLKEAYKKASLDKLKAVHEGLSIGKANFDVTRNEPTETKKSQAGYLDRTTMTYK